MENLYLAEDMPDNKRNKALYTHYSKLKLENRSHLE